jgi:N-sulfoglucosamine sulfohydrolase
VVGSWTRRDVLRAAGATVAVGPLFACGSARTPERILFITADDLGWKDLSSAGNPNASTPNLDRLEARGVSFSHAFDVTSTCSSSRTTYATGQYPHTHGVTGLVHRMPELSLPDGSPTLARHLRDAGYVTAIEGKFHLAFPSEADRFGYQEVMTTLATQWIVDASQTIDFIRRRGRERWFLELNYMNPHRNLLGAFTQHADHPRDPAALTMPEYMVLPDVPGAREELAAYYSQVDRMDVMIGEVVAALEADGLLDDTLIAFISDNGSPFPHNKLTLYDRGTGTPFFFHWPAALESRRSAQLVSSVDLMPTLLDLAGVEIPASVQGRSLAPLLAGDDFAASDVVFGEMTAHTGPAFPMRSVRDRRYRYIRNDNDLPVPLEGGGQDWVQALELAEDHPWRAPRAPEELYDLEVDPNEQDNRVDDDALAPVLARLRGRLDEHLAATNDPYGEG